MDRELLIVAAAVALVFALPVAMLCWIAVQWAQARVTDRRLDGLEVAVRRLLEERHAAPLEPEPVAGDAAPVAIAGEVPVKDELAIERLDDDYDVAAVPPENQP